MLLLNVRFIKLLLYWAGDIMSESYVLLSVLCFILRRASIKGLLHILKHIEILLHFFKLLKFDPILSTQIQRLNNRLTCNPFKVLLFLATGRCPLVLLY